MEGFYFGFQATAPLLVQFQLHADDLCLIGRAGWFTQRLPHCHLRRNPRCHLCRNPCNLRLPRAPVTLRMRYCITTRTTLSSFSTSPSVPRQSVGSLWSCLPICVLARPRTCGSSVLASTATTAAARWVSKMYPSTASFDNFVCRAATG
jgi:hypothetical protein